MGYDKVNFSEIYANQLMEQIKSSVSGSDDRIMKITTLLYYYNMHLQNIYRQYLSMFDLIIYKVIDFKEECEDSTNHYKNELVRMCNEIIINHPIICDENEYILPQYEDYENDIITFHEIAANFALIKIDDSVNDDVSSESSDETETETETETEPETEEETDEEIE